MHASSSSPADTRPAKSPAALQLEIEQLEALPHRSAQQLMQLALSYQALSAWAEQAADWATALRHYQRFHRLSLLAMAPEVLSREQLGEQLATWAQTPGRMSSDFCLVALSVDTLGEATDEPSPSSLSALLRLQCRPDDLLAQRGRGAGLLLALADVDLPSARKVCERVRSAWAQQQGGSLSMGLSAWRGAIDEPLRLIERAESGLAAAKQAGGNCLRSGTT